MLIQSSEGRSCGKEGGGATLKAPDSKGQQNKFFLSEKFDLCAQQFLNC